MTLVLKILQRILKGCAVRAGEKLQIYRFFCKVVESLGKVVTALTLSLRKASCFAKFSLQ